MNREICSLRSENLLDMDLDGSLAARTTFETELGMRWVIDDFRGCDLYQRFGGGPTTGYGDTPVAVHIYEIG